MITQKTNLQRAVNQLLDYWLQRSRYNQPVLIRLPVRSGRKRVSHKNHRSIDR